MLNTRLRFMSGVLAGLVIWLAGAAAQDVKPVPLPKPQTTGGRPFMQVLGERASVRTFGPQEPSPQVLANLLWAAFGITRADGRRTAPSAYNMQEVDIYVARRDGLYLWAAKENTLQPILKEDIRAATGTQPYVGSVPLNLVYVADYARMKARTEEEKPFYSAADTGFIAQNVYLFCSSEGLACVVRALVDRPALAKIMGLRPDQRVILTQSVGYPAK